MQVQFNTKYYDGHFYYFFVIFFFLLSWFLIKYILIVIEILNKIDVDNFKSLLKIGEKIKCYTLIMSRKIFLLALI